MSNNDATKRLYTEYRAAMRERDDKKAYTILKKITEVDPKDTTARMQCEAMAGKVIENSLAALGKMSDLAEIKRFLSELETLFPASQLNKYQDYARAKERSVKSMTSAPRKDERLVELRRSLRDALLSREKEKAYDLLEEICEIAPTDQDAQRQRKETGKFLCRQYASEMQRLTHSGETPELSSLVDRMRRWASASVLAQIDGYQAAEELVNRYQRHEVEKEIAHRLAVLRTDTELSAKERYDEVVEVEEMAAKYALEMQGEDAALVRSIKKAMRDEEEARKRTQVLTELGGRYTELWNSMDPISDASDQILTEKLPLLEDLMRQATALGEHPEVEEFTDPVMRKITSIRRLLNQRRKTRRLKVLVRGAVTALIVLLLAIGGYAWYNAGVAIEEMRGIRDEIRDSEYTVDKMEKLRVLTSSTPFGYSLTKLFLPDHQVTFRECVKFVKRFDGLRGRLAGVMGQMRILSGKLDPGDPDASKVSEYVPLVRTARSLMGELSQEYHYEPTPGERQAEQDYQDNVVVAMRPRFLTRYTTPPTTVTLAELEKLWLEYKELNAVFSFNEEETKTIYAAFADAARSILLCVGKPGGAEIPDLRSSIELFDKYHESLELDEGLRDEIAVVLKKLEGFVGIDSKLRGALSLADYLYSIADFETAYFRVSDLYDYRPLKAWYEDDSGGDKLEALALRVKATSLHALPRKWECNRELFEKIKSIFEEGKSVYLEYQEGTLGVVIDRITRDGKNEGGMWKKILRVAVDGGVVYPGERSKINGTTTIRLLDTYGNEKEGQVHRSSTVHGERDLKFADMREKIGFVGKNMLKGAVLPIDFLRRTATERKNSAYPVMALAWLFNETINLMEAYPEPLANGIALSPSLQKDIREFKALVRHMDIGKGCWLIPHKMQHENELTSFFARCESKNYKTEILQNLNTILNARLLYAGYIGETGQRFLLSTFQGMSLYHIVWNQKNDPLLVPVAEKTKLQRFTPVFVLK